MKLFLFLVSFLVANVPMVTAGQIGLSREKIELLRFAAVFAKEMDWYKNLSGTGKDEINQEPSKFYNILIVDDSGNWFHNTIFDATFSSPKKGRASDLENIVKLLNFVASDANSNESSDSSGLSKEQKESIKKILIAAEKGVPNLDPKGPLRLVPPDYYQLLMEPEFRSQVGDELNGLPENIRLATIQTLAPTQVDAIKLELGKISEEKMLVASIATLLHASQPSILKGGTKVFKVVPKVGASFYSYDLPGKRTIYALVPSLDSDNPSQVLGANELMATKVDTFILKDNNVTRIIDRADAIKALGPP